MTNQPPKDFLALSHGHEWVNFYESFDLLVQDHLSRSSELLRKAMSLPEVADREVQEIRDDLEMQIKTERERTHATLSVLQEEISKSRDNISVMAAMASGLLSEIDNLASSVEAAISQATATAEAVPVDGFVDMPTDSASEDQASLTAEELVVDAEADVTDEAEVSEVETSDAEGETVDADAAWEQLAEEVDATAETDDDSEIDLNALAEAEQLGVTSDDSDEAVTADSGERTRPHWLNMARSNGDGS